ncbi:MAG: hypothetical protein HY744_12155 [Deltaproteobacteria bacterium]|nr:hypothetical protein [Deltaproteobacteria bacterium]
MRPALAAQFLSPGYCEIVSCEIAAATGATATATVNPDAAIGECRADNNGTLPTELVWGGA